MRSGIGDRDRSISRTAGWCMHRLRICYVKSTMNTLVVNLAVLVLLAAACRALELNPVEPDSVRVGAPSAVAACYSAHLPHTNDTCAPDAVCATQYLRVPYDQLFTAVELRALWEALPFVISYFFGGWDFRYHHTTLIRNPIYHTFAGAGFSTTWSCCRHKYARGGGAARCHLRAAGLAH